MHIALFMFILGKVTVTATDTGGSAVEDVGLRPFGCWDCEFESR